MNRALLATLLLGLAVSQITFNLEREKIAFAGFEDQVCYHKALFNTDSSKTKAVFDTSTHYSWHATTTGTGTGNAYGIGASVHIQHGASVKDTVEIGEHKLKQVDVVEGDVAPSTQASVPNPNPWTKELKAGFALGIGKGSFLKEITQIEKLEYEAFSFYFRESEKHDISQIRFGAPEGFFSTGPPTLFQTQTPTGDSGFWIVHITNVGLDASNTKTWNQNAYFQSTTRYSYITNDQYNWLKTTLTNYYGILFSNGDQCPCTSEKNPQIFFQFSNGPGSPNNAANAQQKFNLDYSDFVVKNSDGTCHLAFRPGIPANGNIILGTSFLKGVYVWFYNPSQGQATVRMANAYKVDVQPKKLDENYRLAFIIVGLVLLALSLLFLLSVLKKVPYQPQPKVVSQQQQFVQPQSYVIQQQYAPQQMVMRSTVSPGVVMGQRSISPQRVVYSQQPQF